MSPEGEYHKAEQQWMNELSDLEVGFREAVRKLSNRFIADGNEIKADLWNTNDTNRKRTLCILESLTRLIRELDSIE